MKVAIHDTEALRAVPPAALSAWAHTAGWRRTGTYRKHSDVYEAPGKPEIVLPRTQRLGDYATVVSDIIRIFAADAGRDELSLYRDLVTADSDVIRVRAVESEDGSLPLEAGVDLVQGARDLLLAAACSLRDRPLPLYRVAAHRDANALLNRFRLGQTEQGSFTVTLLSAPLTPALRPPTQLPLFSGDEAAPISEERRLTQRFAEALSAAREAAESVVSAPDSNAFAATVSKGVSANLCEALVKVVAPFSAVDIGVHWAWTRPMNSDRNVFRFATADAPILRGAAEAFRARAPKPDMEIYGFIQRLSRSEEEVDGTIYLTTQVEGQTCSVAALLTQSDYERAIQAHRDRAVVTMRGDLQRNGQRWRLYSPEITGVINRVETEEG